MSSSLVAKSNANETRVDQIGDRMRAALDQHAADLVESAYYLQGEAMGIRSRQPLTPEEQLAAKKFVSESSRVYETLVQSNSIQNVFHERAIAEASNRLVQAFAYLFMAKVDALVRDRLGKDYSIEWLHNGEGESWGHFADQARGSAMQKYCFRATISYNSSMINFMRIGDWIQDLGIVLDQRPPYYSKGWINFILERFAEDRDGSIRQTLADLNPTEIRVEKEGERLLSKSSRAAHHLYYMFTDGFPKLSEWPRIIGSIFEDRASSGVSVVAGKDIRELSKSGPSFSMNAIVHRAK